MALGIVSKNKLQNGAITIGTTPFLSYSPGQGLLNIAGELVDEKNSADQYHRTLPRRLSTFIYQNRLFVNTLIAIYIDYLKITVRFSYFTLFFRGLLAIIGSTLIFNR